MEQHKNYLSKKYITLKIVHKIKQLVAALIISLILIAGGIAIYKTIFHTPPYEQLFNYEHFKKNKIISNMITSTNKSNLLLEHAQWLLGLAYLKNKETEKAIKSLEKIR